MKNSFKRVISIVVTIIFIIGCNPYYANAADNELFDDNIAGINAEDDDYNVPDTAEIELTETESEEFTEEEGLNECDPEEYTDIAYDEKIEECDDAENRTYIDSDNEDVSEECSEIEPQNASDTWYKDFEYTLDNKAKTITLSGWESDKTEAEVKSTATINGVQYSVLLSRETFSNMGSHIHNLKKIVIRDKVKVIDAFGLFWCSFDLEELDISGLDTSEVTSMNQMFSGCHSLKKIDVSGLDTSNVETMDMMFMECYALEEIDVSGFDTTNVNSMEDIFKDCTSLKNIDISGFNTRNLEDAFGMFLNCKSLTTVKLNGCDMSKVKNVERMFYGCNKLSKLDLSGFDMTNVSKASDMLSGCTSLTEICTPVNLSEDMTIDIPVFGLKDENGKTYNSLPNGSSGKKSILLSDSWDTWYKDYEYTLDDTNSTITLTGYNGSATEIKVPSSVRISGKTYNVVLSIKPEEKYEMDPETFRWSTNYYHDWSEVESVKLEKGVSVSDDCSHLFAGCEQLTDIDISELDTSNVMYMNGMFEQCGKITSLKLNSFSTQNVVDMGQMFGRCYSLHELDISGFVTNRTRNMSGMFASCYNIEHIDVSGFDTRNVESMSGMFGGCRSLKSINVSSFNTENVTNMNGMFSDCRTLEKIDISNFSGEKLENVESMFSDCWKVKSIMTNNLITEKVNRMDSLFNGCKELEEIDLSLFDVSNVDDLRYLFAGCSKIKEIDISSFRFGNYCSLYHVFENCTSLEKVVLGKHTTIFGMGGMFSGCTNLEEIDLSDLELDKVSGIDDIFMGCTNLEKVNLGEGFGKNLQSARNAFSGCSSLREVDFSGMDLSGVRASVKEDLYGYEGLLDGCTNLVKISAPEKINANLQFALPLNMYELKDGKVDKNVTYTDLTKAPANTVLVSDNYEDPVPENKDLSLESLAYSFNNSRTSFGYSNPYKIPLERYIYLWGDNPKARYVYKNMGNWGGNCFGFSSSSELLVNSKNDVNVAMFSDNAKMISDLKVTDRCNALDLDVKAFIEVMHVSQRTVRAQRDLAHNKVYTYELSAGTKNLNALYNYVINSNKKGEPVILAAFQNGSGHALLAYKTEDISSDESRIYVYDCNYPKATRYFTVEKDNNNNIVSWKYDMGGYGIWGTDSESSLTFVNCETVEEIWAHRGDQEDGTNVACINTKDFSIYDVEDNCVATVKNGTLNTNLEDIYLMVDEMSLEEGDNDDMLTVVFPADVYTIKNDDTELDNLHLEIVDTEQGAIIDTTADEVVLAVIDDYAINSIQLNADADDSYCIVLDSSIDGDVGNVIVEGTGCNDGKMVSVSQSLGEINIENGIISSAMFDGKEALLCSVSANAGTGGTISPEGTIMLQKGVDQTYKITPDKDYEIDCIIVDGVSVEVSSEYTFKSISSDHSIEVRFRKIKAERGLPVIDESTTSITLVKGQKFLLNDKTWKSSASNVVTVKNGLVTVKKEGRAEISKQGQSVSVTVVKPEFAQKSIKLVVGRSEKLVMNNTAGKEVLYVSLSPDTATVDENGNVKAISKGNAVINAWIEGVMFKCTVKVTDVDTTKKDFRNVVELAPMQSVSMKIQGFSPKKAVWSSDSQISSEKLPKGYVFEDSVVRITKAGKITAIGSGETTLTATGGSGSPVNITIRVNEPVVRTLHIEKGKTKTLKIYGVKGTLEWKADDTGIVSFDKNKITGTNEGSTIIRSSYEGFTYEVMIFVEKSELKTGNKLSGRANKYSVSMKVGETLELESMCLYQPLFFSSNKNYVAFAEENRITAVSAGDAKITTKVNGQKITINVKVTE